MSRCETSVAGSCGVRLALARMGEEFLGRGSIWNQQVLDALDFSTCSPVSSTERGLWSRWDMKRGGYFEAGSEREPGLES